MVPVDFLRRLFAGIRKPRPNMNSCSTKCLRLLQAKEMSLVKSRSWFSQPWTVTMCVYLLMDKRAQEKLSPWRETPEIMRQREWSHGPWNKCFGHPKTSEKKVGRWEMVRCFCLCDLSLKKKKHNLIDPIICIKLWTWKVKYGENLPRSLRQFEYFSLVSHFSCRKKHFFPQFLLFLHLKSSYV